MVPIEGRDFVGHAIYTQCSHRRREDPKRHLDWYNQRYRQQRHHEGHCPDHAQNGTTSSYTTGVLVDRCIVNAISPRISTLSSSSSENLLFDISPSQVGAGAGQGGGCPEQRKGPKSIHTDDPRACAPKCNHVEAQVHGAVMHEARSQERPPPPGIKIGSTRHHVLINKRLHLHIIPVLGNLREAMYARANPNDAYYNRLRQVRPNRLRAMLVTLLVLVALLVLVTLLKLLTLLMLLVRGLLSQRRTRNVASGRLQGSENGETWGAYYTHLPRARW